MGTYRRMIVKDMDNSPGYMVLKPDGDGFHRIGRHYNKRSLFNYFKQIEKQHKRGEIDRVCFLLDPSLVKDCIRNFSDIGELVELLELKQGVKVES